MRELSPTQQRVYTAMHSASGVKADAARELGMSASTVSHHCRAIREKGHSIPEAPRGTNGITKSTVLVGDHPPDQKLRGVSTLYDARGNVKAQWVKSERDKTRESLKALREAARDAFSDVSPVPPVKGPRRAAKDLCAAYVMGDPHIGLYSWKDETGEDFDLDIAERTLTEAVARLVAATPDAEQGVIVNVGDYFHGDDSTNMTRRSGAILDVDTRWAKVLKVGIRAMRTCIEHALTKHKRVHVINATGNHDIHSAVMLTICLASFYAKNKRVTFEESPAKFLYYRFGKNLVGVTHGDGIKPADLGGIMAADRPADWGDTKHRTWWTGHIHHKTAHELHGCTVESFRTLAAKDAWTAASGYRSGRDMQAIVLHRDHGEIERHRVDVGMLA